MSTNIDKQILITRSALEMISDIHEKKTRLTFPHFNRTGIAQSQIFDLLEGLDPLVSYYIKKYHVATTADQDGNFTWTFLTEYIPNDRETLSAMRGQAEHAARFLAGKLFQEQMPDYMKVYRACAFLCGCLNFNNNSDTAVYGLNPYGALINGACGCQGFAGALKLLLKEAGVPCMTISGTVLKDTPAFSAGRFEQDPRTKSTRHYWNLVGIETTDGILYFHVDVCWGQQDKDMNFDFFLKDDFYMKKYLKWDEAAYPACQVIPGEDIEKLIKAG